MTHFDEELAALLALDALEKDEQADAELRMGTFPAELTEASAALAEVTAVRPPAQLRRAALARALQRRAAGRPVDAVTPCPPAEAFDRTVADFAALLSSLTEVDWNAPAHDEHGRVRDLVAHLVGIERLSARWLDADDDVPPVLDHVAATAPVVDELAGASTAELARIWHESALAVAAGAATGDPDRQVTFHDLSSSIDGFLVTRSFELWAHSMDIAGAVDRPLPVLDPERMATLSGALMAVVPMAMAYRGASRPGRTARFVLTGSSGGCYTVTLDPESPESSPGEPDVVIVADTVDLCRVAARRLGPAELRADIEGDRALAEQVLADLDAFARD